MMMCASGMYVHVALEPQQVPSAHLEMSRKAQLPFHSELYMLHTLQSTHSLHDVWYVSTCGP